MTNIHGIQPPVGPQPVDALEAAVAKAPEVQPADVADVVEISDVARLAARLQEVPEVRAELVQRVKDEIAAGTYETSERIEITVDRLMEEFFGEL